MARSFKTRNKLLCDNLSISRSSVRCSTTLTITHDNNHSHSLHCCPHIHHHHIACHDARASSDRAAHHGSNETRSHHDVAASPSHESLGAQAIHRTRDIDSIKLAEADLVGSRDHTSRVSHSWRGRNHIELHDHDDCSRFAIHTQHAHAAPVVHSHQLPTHSLAVSHISHCLSDTNDEIRQHERHQAQLQAQGMSCGRGITLISSIKPTHRDLI